MIDFAAPLPAGDALSVDGESLHAEHLCESALERFRVRLDGLGAVHPDAAALLRGEDGEAVDVAFDLVWRPRASPTPTVSRPVTRSPAA